MSNIDFNSSDLFNTSDLMNSENLGFGVIKDSESEQVQRTQAPNDQVDISADPSITQSIGILDENDAKALSEGQIVDTPRIYDAEGKTPDQLKAAHDKGLLALVNHKADGSRDLKFNDKIAGQFQRQAQNGHAVRGFEYHRKDGTVERVDAKFTIGAMSRLESQVYLQQAYSRLLLAADQLRRIREEQIEHEHKEMMLAQKNLESPHPKPKENQAAENKKLLDVIKEQQKEPLPNVSSDQVKQDKAAQESHLAKKAKEKALEHELDNKSERIEQKAEQHEQTESQVKESAQHQSQLQGAVTSKDVNRTNKTATENEITTKPDPNPNRKAEKSEVLPVLVQKVNPLRRHII